MPAPRSWWVVPLLAAAALALYGGALRYPLVFDDELLTDVFLRHYASSVSPFERRWYSYASFGWVRALAGSDWFWQRLANVLLHAAVASVLFAFLARLFGVVLADGRAAAAPPLHPSWLAFSGALLFLAHPAALYGVAYLIQRSILLATLWCLVSLWLFLEGLQRGSRGWFFAAAAAYFVAVYSKEQAVMLPAVAAALAVLLRGPKLRLMRELALPFALYAAIALLVTLEMRGLLGVPFERFAADAVRKMQDPAQAAAGTALFPLSILNQGTLFFRYLLAWLLPWPGWMSIDLRPAFPVQLLSWPQAAGFAAWLAWPVLGATLLARGGRAGLAGLALLAPWLLGITEMVTVRVQEVFVLYRSYLWMCLLPAALPAILARCRPRWALALLAAAGLALLPPFFDRLATFSSNLALWDDAVRKNLDLKAPYVDRAFRNRGVAYYHAERLAEARADFNRALELDAGNPKNWLLRGALNLHEQQHENAIADYDRLLALEPGHQPALASRCVALMHLRRFDEALADCSRAAELDPNDFGNHTSLGVVHAMRGSVAAAERSYRRALELAPHAGAARYQYGVLLRGMGRNAEARREFMLACGERVQVACRALRMVERPR